MNYQFSITLTSNNLSDDALFAAGCDDALVCRKDDVTVLHFDRESTSYCEAVRSAVQDLELASARELFNDYCLNNRDRIIDTQLLLKSCHARYYSYLYSRLSESELYDYYYSIRQF